MTESPMTDTLPEIGQPAHAAGRGPENSPATSPDSGGSRTAVAQAQEHLHQLRSELEQARGMLKQLERRRDIDARLLEHDVLDLEAARLLAEAALDLMQEPDVQQAVAELKKRKPQLFGRRQERAAMFMAARRGQAGVARHHAADRALATGNLRDLLMYLRLRRTA